MAPQSSIPPSLPPSVEEAYRRKCIQLKQRTAEVEEENDATRVRLARIRRQVEKLRVERAFLLEQLAKRTSTNVEDSEGSPSPPPTVGTPPLLPRHSPSIGYTPKEKPLRTKRGHRKPSMLADIEASTKASSTFISQNISTLSPSSESFSHTQGDTQATNPSSSRANGVSKPPKRPANAFELYCNDTRPSLSGKDRDPELNIEEELARGWKDLPETEKEEYQARYDQELAQYQKDKEAYSQKSKAEVKSEREKSSERPAPETQDEDVEMTNYDTEEQEQEQETQADEKAEE